MARPSTAIDLGAVLAAQARWDLTEEEAWAILGPLVEALPPAWRTLTTGDDGAMFQHQDGRRVILSIARHEGKRWLHASLSRPNRMPSYEEMCELHEAFLGADRRALEVFAPRSQHVNFHKFCRHLWACIDGDGLPDFTEGTGSI